MSLQWLQQQRSTPSFASAKGAVEQATSALEQPMPAALRHYGHEPMSAADDLLQPDDTNPLSPMSIPPRNATSPSVRRARTPGAGGQQSATRARSVGSTYTSQVVDPRGISRQINVFDSLVERGKLAAEAKDRARAEAVKAELRRCRSVPKINRMNDDNMMPSTNSIFQRLINKDNERIVRHQTKVLIMQKKEEEHLATLFQPRISSKGHRAKGTTTSVTSGERYSFKTLQRMEDIRKEKIMKEMEAIMDTPDINQRSNLLAQRQREREGLAGYSHIEAMLERDRLNKLARYEQRERELIAQTPGTPRITEYAASLHRGGESTHDRLYRSAVSRANDTTASNAVPTSIYTPGRTARDGGSEFRNLARHEHETRVRKEERMRQLLEAEQLSHAPTINPVSASIASRLPTTTEDRLSATTPRRAATSLSIGASTARTRSEHGGGAPTERDLQLFERLRIAEARRKMRIETARQELEQRREEECTFAPVTTTTYYPPQRQERDLYDRSLNWQHHREEKLRQQKAEQLQMAEEKLTFQPAVSRKTQEMYERGGAYTYDGAGGSEVAGFETFVARQQRGRHSDPNQEVDKANQWNTSTVVEASGPRVVKARATSPAASKTPSSIRRPVDPPNPTVYYEGRPQMPADGATKENAGAIRAQLFTSSGPFTSIYGPK